MPIQGQDMSSMKKVNHYGIDITTARAWKLNEYDWIAANNLEEGLKWYMEQTGLSREEAIDPDHFRECPLHETFWTVMDGLPEPMLEVCRIFQREKVGDREIVKTKTNYAEFMEYIGELPGMLASTEY